MATKPKVRKLLRKLREFLDDDYKAQIHHADSIKVVLKKLKKRQKALEARCGNTDEAETRLLEEQILVVRAQRKKGLKALKELQQRPA